jgi:Domain of unknown function (DUF6391)
MSDSISNQFLGLLNVSPLQRIRRNHGLEHATLNLLSRRLPGRPLAGHSDLNGFWIVGDLSTEDLALVVQEAWQRLYNGERELAVHPSCGTNYVVAGVLAGISAAGAMFGVGRRFRDKLERLPLAITLATFALVLAQPLGLLLQEKVTTSSELGLLRVVEILPGHRGRLKMHRIITQS